MKFFKAKDFMFVDLQEKDDSSTRFGPSEKIAQRMADDANEKLEREGVVVYGEERTTMGETWVEWGGAILNPVPGGPNPNNYPEPTHKALVINVEKLGAKAEQGDGE